MSTVLDGSIAFYENELEVELASVARGTSERAVPGLDGLISVDLGGRGRKIKQRGVLRARSRMEMQEKIEAIGVLLDGDVHTLATDKYGQLGNLRVDVFETKNERTSGGGMAVDYEIVYRQLVV